MFKKKTHKNNQFFIFAPLSGTLVEIEKVQDSVFANKMLGDGFAIIPSEKKAQIFAPITGKLTTVMDSGHAYGITETTTGIECLVHIGLDTVELDGKPFAKRVSLNQQVNHLDELVFVNFSEVVAAEKDPITPVVFAANSLNNKYRLEVTKKLFNTIVNKGDIIAEIVAS